MSNLALRSIARQVRDLNVAKRGATSLYVDGTNGSDTFTGESWRQALATIQEAVDVADSWTQIFIKAGTYAEGILIDSKNDIALIGENRATTIIKPAASYGMWVKGIGCSVSSLTSIGNGFGQEAGLYITGDGFTADDLIVGNQRTDNGKGIHGDSEHSTYRNILIDQTYPAAYGIHLDANNIEVYNCILENNSTDAILFGDSNWSKVHDNTIISAGGKGCRITGGANYNTIYHNNFVASTIDDGTIGSVNKLFENYYSLHTNIDNGFGIATEPYAYTGGTDPRPICVRNGWLGLSWADADSVADILADVTDLASVCTEARLAELDAANLPADIDAILTNQRKRWNWNCLTGEYMVIAGTWETNSDSNMYLGMTLYNSSAALDDEIAIPFYAFSTDAVTLNCRCSVHTARGILTAYVDDASQGTIDLYGVAHSNIIRTLSITPARAGLNVLRLKITGKNASSSSYVTPISELWLS